LTTHAVFGLFIIVRILSINIVGGMGTLWGPVVAAAILVPLGEFLNAQFGHRAPGVQDVVYGAALIATIIFLPAGIWGKITESFQHRKSRSRSVTSPVETTLNLGRALSEEETASIQQRLPNRVTDHSETGRDRQVFGGVMAIKT
jgi:branched-chain amino acid transport system permease protein